MGVDQMHDTEARIQCVATTKAGTRCKHNAIPGEDYCHIHRPITADRTATGSKRSSVDGESGTKDLTDGELREQLMEELDSLITRVQAISPDYRPSAYASDGTNGSTYEETEGIDPDLQNRILSRLRGSINEDLLDAETWKGLWYMVNYTVEYQSDIFKRRLSGDYDTDEWGLDWEFVEAVRPFLDFLYNVYWRIETTGIEHIPDYDRALLVSNHSGQLPWDGAMIMTAILNEHPAQRLARNLYANWFPTLPFISSALVKMGQALATVENGTRLLNQDELVGVFPEGYKGVGKLYKDRYKLARFGRGGFVKMAINTQAPIIPVSVVGAEETYVTVAKSSILARLTGFPYFPISLRFPWLGLMGAIPLPSKWYIDFGEPIATDSYNSEDTKDLALVSELTDHIRNIIQEMINNRLKIRRSVFR
jgi:1-acyl-sn-glycerol-3-phosphate acyltransferase